MSITLGSNIASLQSQRALGLTTKKLGRTYERLASGQRINSVADDPAGLAIADSLRTDTRLLNGAKRNISDGISLINIMDGALAVQNDILVRLSELAEQSANGVYSDTQRSALNQEYQELVRESARLGEVTEFNGFKVLQGERGSNPSQINFQAGITGELNSILSLAAIDSSSFSGVITVRDDVTDTGNTTPYDGSPDGTVDIDDFTYAQQVESGTPTFEQIAAYAQNNIFTIETTDSNGEERTLLGVLSFGDYGSGGSNRASITLYAKSDDGDDYYKAGNRSLVEESVRESDQLGFSLSFAGGATGSISLDFRGLDLSTDNTGTKTQTSIEFTGVETASRALHALDRLSNRMEELSGVRAQIGAIHSRLLTASNVVATSSEAYAASESRIRDADIAEEAANLATYQILQQASTAVLSQANVQPSLALSLL